MKKLGIVLLISLIITSCDLGSNGKSNNDPTTDQTSNKTTLYVSGYGLSDNPEGLAFIENIQGFEAKYPQYKVVYTLKYEDAYHASLEYDLTSGKHLDIIANWNESDKLQKIVNNNEHIDQTQFLDQSNFCDNSLRGTGPNGELWVVPRSKHANSVLYANEELLATLGLTVPTTYDELLAQQATAIANSKFMISYPGGENWIHDPFLFSLVLGRVGGSQFVNGLIDRTNTFNDAEVVDTLNFIKHIYDNNILTSLSSPYATSLYYFNSGQSLYLLDNDSRATDITLTNYSFNSFPAITGEITPNSSSVGFSSLGYSITRSGADGVNKEGAKLLLNYLVGKEASLVRAKLIGEVPIYNIAEPIVYKSDAEDRVSFIQSLSNLTPTFGDYVDSLFISAVSSDIQEMMLGSLTPLEVAGRAHAHY